MANTSTEDTFNTVDARLEKGGLVYGIVNVDGDLNNLAIKTGEMLHSLSKLNPQLAMAAAFPVSNLMDQTGLTSIRAIGISSTERDVGYHNRTFILTDGTLKGFLALNGTENQPFELLKMAPVGTDLAVEQRMDTQVLIDVVQQMVVSVMGEMGNQMLTMYLDKPIGTTPFTARELLAALKGRSIMILDVNETEFVEYPKFGTFPKVDFIVQFENGGNFAWKIADMLSQANLPNFKSEEKGDTLIMSGFLPKEVGFDFVIQGNQSTGEFVLYSSENYYNAFKDSSGNKLVSTVEFAAATKDLPMNGLSIAYLSPSLNNLVGGYIEKSMQAEGAPQEAIDSYVDWVTDGIFTKHPVASVSVLEPNGFFVKSNWHATHKQNLSALAYANPVTIGLMAAMAIPAFQKVRQTSQQKTILNNLRQLASAAQQKMLEEGVRSVRTQDLIGPDAYIHSFEPVMGETYPEVITVETIVIEAVLPNGEKIEYRF